MKKIIVNNYQYGTIKNQFEEYIIKESDIDSKHKELIIKDNNNLINFLKRKWANIKPVEI